MEIGTEASVRLEEGKIIPPDKMTFNEGTERDHISVLSELS